MKLDERGIEAAHTALIRCLGRPTEHAATATVTAYLAEAFAYREPTDADIGKRWLTRWKHPGEHDVKREWIERWDGYAVKPVEIRPLPPEFDRPEPTEAP